MMRFLLLNIAAFDSASADFFMDMETLFWMSCMDEAMTPYWFSLLFWSFCLFLIDSCSESLILSSFKQIALRSSFASGSDCSSLKFRVDLLVAILVLQ